jgi:hypothetical protein
LYQKSGFIKILSLPRNFKEFKDSGTFLRGYLYMRLETEGKDIGKLSEIQIPL